MVTNFVHMTDNDGAGGLEDDNDNNDNDDEDNDNRDLKVIPWFCTAHLLLRITRWPP